MIRSAALLLGVFLSGHAIAQTNIPYSDPNSSRRESRRSSSSGNSSTNGVGLQPFNPYGGLSSKNNQGANSNSKAGANAKATPAAGAKATPATSGSTRGATTAKTGTTSGTGTLARKPNTPGQPGSKGGSESFAQTGRVQEVTKEMVASMRTRRVEFDAEEMADQPGVILLNARKLSATE